MINLTELPDDIQIFKYIPGDYIEHLLEGKYIFFNKINRWPDMMELYLDRIINPDMVSKRYGSCWTLHKGIERIVDEASRQNAMDEIRRNGLDSGPVQNFV